MAMPVPSEAHPLSRMQVSQLAHATLLAQGTAKAMITVLLRDMDSVRGQGWEGWTKGAANDERA